MKKQIAFLSIILTLVFGLGVLGCFAQNIGINATGATPNISAGLDVDFNNKGLLIPRMTTVQRDAIASPAQSLLIYNITTKCFEFFENAMWQTFGCACTIPAQPSTITGITPVCQGNSAVAYSVTNVGGVTYTWTYSGTGYTQASGGTTNSITANFSGAATSGTLTVTPSNACGNGTAQTFAITVSATPTGSQVFSYTGAVQTWPVPACVTFVTIEALGAGSSGLGGKAVATFTVTPGDILNIYVGGSNGYNGGGSSCGVGTVGGGMSDIKLNGTATSNIILAAGGGGGQGGATTANQGGAGGFVGTVGANGVNSGAGGGTGGTQSFGGAGGVNQGDGGSGSPGTQWIGGAAGVNGSSGHCGGGGGGGFYGGGGGGGSGINNTGGNGGGGSSYIINTASATSTTSNVQSGNGQVTITWP